MWPDITVVPGALWLPEESRCRSTWIAESTGVCTFSVRLHVVCIEPVRASCILQSSPRDFIPLSGIKFTILGWPCTHSPLPYLAFHVCG